jgi:ABC-type uncharacterized transport system permease subunit
MTLIISILALILQVPLVLHLMRQAPRRDGIFWAFLALALAGPLGWVALSATTNWPTGFAAALWITIAATQVLFGIVAWIDREAWRLAPLVASYMVLLGAGAIAWDATPEAPLAVDLSRSGWIVVHVATTVATYGLVTIAAIAALAAFLQEKALKRKRPNVLTRSLPAMTDCEALAVRLLGVGEAILAVGLATGMALQYLETGRILAFNHKNVLTIAAFVVIGALLVAHGSLGVRGARAARLALLGYLLLTLGYPGVKFVTDVLMA